MAVGGVVRRLARPLSSLSRSRETTHFGFQTVDERDKGKRVYEVFRDVARDYDLMNDAMSFGVHRLWKDAFVDRLGLLPGARLLDVAGGTGDVAFRCAERLRAAADRVRPGPAPRSEVVVLDVNREMLDVGRRRAREAGLESDGRVDLRWTLGDAHDLRLPDESFSAYTVAFGIRNCTRIPEVLKEAFRVLRPGGRFACLEFSAVDGEAARRLYDAYSFGAVPATGRLAAGKWRPYRYLVESIRRFPDGETFGGMIEEAGFRDVSWSRLSLGVCAIHSGTKLK